MWEESPPLDGGECGRRRAERRVRSKTRATEGVGGRKRLWVLIQVVSLDENRIQKWVYICTSLLGELVVGKGHACAGD